MPNYLYRDGSNICYLNGSTWTNIGTGNPNMTMFNTYGMSSVASQAYVNLLNSPELLFYVNDTTARKLQITIPGSEIYYVVSFDNGTTWKSYMNNTWVTVTDITTQGMTKAQFESITQAQWASIFVQGSLKVKMYLKSNDAAVTPYVDSIAVALLESYIIGSSTVISNDTMQFNTLDWKSITNVQVTQTTPTGTDIHFAVSNDGRLTWQVFRNNVWTTITDFTNLGMSKQEFEAITLSNWQPIIDTSGSRKLDVCVLLMNSIYNDTPSIDQITFNYAKISTPDICKEVKIPLPDKGYRNVLTLDEYVLSLAEGIAFDDNVTANNFYSTPDKIKLRALDTGITIGGHLSPVFAVEVMNTFTNKDFIIKIRISKDGQYAAGENNKAYLNDATKSTERTVIEVSANNNPFSSEYPLYFGLNRLQNKIIYFRFKPTLTTSGQEFFQISATAQPV